MPERFAASFERLLERLSRSWAIAGPGDLRVLLERGPETPTLVVCFDDGLANTVRIAAPILESRGARAIFAVPAAWPDVPPARQAAWFREHVYPEPTELHDRPGDVAAASWEELRAAVGNGHEVWSHGFDHIRLDRGTPPDVVSREIRESKEVLEAKLGAPIRGFCPPIAYDESSPAAEEAIASTYELAFTGRVAAASSARDLRHIPRTNIEATWPAAAVDLQLTRLGDAISRTAGQVRR